MHTRDHQSEGLRIHLRCALDCSLAACGSAERERNAQGQDHDLEQEVVADGPSSLSLLCSWGLLEGR